MRDDDSNLIQCNIIVVVISTSLEIPAPSGLHARRAFPPQSSKWLSTLWKSSEVGTMAVKVSTITTILVSIARALERTRLFFFQL